MVRYKHRYLVATVKTSADQMTGLEAKDIFAMLKDSIEANFGDFGVGSTAYALQVRSFDHASGVLVIRTGRDSHQMVRASLTFLTGFKDIKLSVTVDGVAGCDRTLKALSLEAYARGYCLAGLDADHAAILLQEQRENMDMQER